ncbi:MAG: FHA domain-containing protein [Planctomycetes bacterium]|nr:FHA domain-containing protein [Planctomycetota bacterium]
MIFPLREGSAILGRSKNCRVCIPAKGISRQHAQCYVTGNEVIIRDLESSNGLFVNNQRVKEARLQDGDVIGLGQFQMIFEAGGDMDATLVEATPIGEEKESHPEDFPEVESVETDSEERADTAVTPEAGVEAPGPPEGKLELAKEQETDKESQENTPVDSMFAPQKYEPKGLAVGPQLIQRDGKWFLRDPATQREIEIVPKGGAGQESPAEAAAPDVVKPVTAPPRKGFRLALAAAAALVLALVILAASGVLNPPPPPPQPGFTRSDYHKALDEGVRGLDEGRIDDALKVFQSSDQKLPDLRVARILADISAMLNNPDQCPPESEIERFGDLLGELKRSVDSTANVESFADRWQGWVDKQVSYRATIDRAVGRLKKGDPDSSLLDLQQVPEDMLIRMKALSYLEEARELFVKKYTNLAKEAELARSWDAAIKHYQKAATVGIGVPVITKSIDLCQQYKQDSSRIVQAKEALDKNDLESVASYLKNISAASPYRTEANSLLSEARQRQDQQDVANLITRVRELYKAGRGQEALKLVNSKPGTVDESEVEAIRRVSEAMDKAENDFRKKDYKTAKEGWLLVLQLEPDDANGYHRLANQRVQEFEQRRVEFAQEYARQGEAAMGKNQFQEAREAFRYAQILDTEGKLGKGGLDHLDKLAREQYQSGLVAEQQGKKEEARAAYLRVKDMAERGSYHYDDAMRRLQRLGGIE